MDLVHLHQTADFNCTISVFRLMPVPSVTLNTLLSFRVLYSFKSYLLMLYTLVPKTILSYPKIQVLSYLDPFYNFIFHYITFSHNIISLNQYKTKLSAWQVPMSNSTVWKQISLILFCSVTPKADLKHIYEKQYK